MSRRRTVVKIAAAGVLGAVASTVLVATPAAAHGTMSSPASRVWVCSQQDSIENPRNAACRAAKQTGSGATQFYDWNEVNIPDANGRHRQIIPDGKLCSAGRAKYAGLDLPRADWPATALQSGATITIRYAAAAPHQGWWEFYMTRPGYDPTQPLKWSDLDATPFHRTENSPSVSAGHYVFNNVRLPQRSGRHLIYSIWQRRLPDSAEAFYSCSDVTFGGTNTPPPPTTAQPTTPPPPTTTAPTTRPPVSPSASHSPSATAPVPTSTAPTSTAAPAWAANTAYAVGARVTYGGRVYQCRQAHTSLPGWEPPNVPALWTAV